LVWLAVWTVWLPAWELLPAWQQEPLLAPAQTRRAFCFGKLQRMPRTAKSKEKAGFEDTEVFVN